MQYDTTRNIGLCYGGGVTYVYGSSANGSLNASYYMICPDYRTSSDERLKDVQDEVNLSIENIADAPSILFKWKNKDDENIYIGTIAQYWQKIAPWAVKKDTEGMLSINYPTLALAASIQCAREIVDLKKRIEKLAERL